MFDHRVKLGTVVEEVMAACHDNDQGNSGADDQQGTAGCGWVHCVIL
jgi:hypothetical protein